MNNKVALSPAVPREDAVNPMKLPPTNVGELIPPNELYKPVLYSHAKATYDFKQIDRDVYETMKKTLPGNQKKKTPTSVWVALGVILLGGLAICKKFKIKFK